MTDTLASVVTGLNAVSNALGTLLAPVGWLPGWLSATLVAVLTGVAMLLMFKWTSNQRAIKKVRRGIRANLLAARLFKNNLRVGLIAQLAVLGGAARLLFLAVVPMLVMAVPMILLLAQLGVWYQAAPLPVGAETTVTVKLGGSSESPIPAVELLPDEASADVTGPVRVFSRREVCWSIRPLKPGYHQLRFRVGDEFFEKEVAVGTDVMKVLPLRPSRNWSDVLLHPRERPFEAGSVIQSVEVEYPARSSWVYGTDNWVIYWFVVSLVAGFCLRGVFKVSF